MKNSLTIGKLFRPLLLILVLSVAVVSFQRLALAAEAAGKVDAVAGQVTVAGADGTIRTLAKDASVFAGDIINTGPNSRVRIVFSDQGVIFLRPSTRFIIDSYKHTNDKEQDESKFSLVKGGFRAVTGAIGQANKENVNFKTPVATIGIRGTDHVGRFCAGDCLDLTNIGVNAPADGLYTGTNVGQTQVGEQPFGPGQYGYTNPARVTVRLPQPPPILVVDPALQGALTMKSLESKEKGAPAPGKEGERPAPKEGGEQQGQSGDNAETEQSEGEGIDIPARPTATREVPCK